MPLSNFPIKKIAVDSLEVGAKKIDVVEILDASYWEGLLNKAINFIPTIIFAFFILFIGFKLVNIFVRILSRIMDRNNCDSSVSRFVATTARVILKLVVIMTFIGILGIKTSAFVAMLGAAGLAIGLALQGTLQNFAGGVVILVLKPFKVSDLVEFGGHKGVVKEIKIFNTIIDKIATNETVIVPNSTIASSTLINWKVERERRVNAQFSIAYGEDIAIVRKLVLEIAANEPRLLPNKPEVLVIALADSSVNLELRVWVKPDDYIAVSSDMLEQIYNKLNDNKIAIPFPQLDVNLKREVR